MPRDEKIGASRGSSRWTDHPSDSGHCSSFSVMDRSSWERLNAEQDHEGVTAGFRTCSQNIRKLVGTVFAEVRSVALSMPSSLARYMST